MPPIQTTRAVLAAVGLAGLPAVGCARGVGPSPAPSARGPATVTVGRTPPEVGDLMLVTIDDEERTRTRVDGHVTRTSRTIRTVVAVTIRALDGDRPIAASFEVRAQARTIDGEPRPPDPTVGKTYEVVVRRAADRADDPAAPADEIELLGDVTEAEREALPLWTIPAPLSESRGTINLDPPGDDVVIEVRGGSVHFARTSRQEGHQPHSGYARRTTTVRWAVELATGRELEHSITVDAVSDLAEGMPDERAGYQTQRTRRYRYEHR